MGIHFNRDGFFLDIKDFYFFQYHIIDTHSKKFSIHTHQRIIAEVFDYIALKKQAAPYFIFYSGCPLFFLFFFRLFDFFFLRRCTESFKSIR